MTTPTLTVTSGPVDPVIVMRPCSRCGTHRPPESFGRDRSRVAGRRSICRDCSNERSREVASLRRQGIWRGRDYARTAPIARLFERVTLVPESLGGRWRWTGPVSRRGYGQIQDRTRGRPVLVHRLAYEWAIGPLTDELELDHLCETKRCDRPEHMEPLTKAEHSRRSCARLDQRRPGWRRGSR